MRRKGREGGRGVEGGKMTLFISIREVYSFTSNLFGMTDKDVN